MIGGGNSGELMKVEIEKERRRRVLREFLELGVLDEKVQQVLVASRKDKDFLIVLREFLLFKQELEDELLEK